MPSNRLLVALTVFFIGLIALFPAESIGPATISRIQDADIYIGVGLSPWSLNDKSASDWISVATYLSEQCGVNGTIAPLLGISIGGMQQDGYCILFTKQRTSDPTDNYIRYGTDYLTPLLTQADNQGVAVFLGVESGRAHVKNLFTILINRAKEHRCVLGFMVDMEWVLEVNKDNRESLIDDWYSQVRSAGNYHLYLVSWVSSRIDRHQTDHMVYLYDGQGYNGLGGVQSYLDQWSTDFQPNDVGVYYGYNSDWDWQRDYSVQVLQEMIVTVPNMRYVLYWTETIDERNL